MSAGPVLVEDVRTNTAFAHAIDAGGDGLPDGPNPVSHTGVGGLFSGVASAGSVGGNLDTTVVAGAQQLSFFEAGGGWVFRADAIARADTATPAGAQLADAFAETGIRLVFRLDQDTEYELSGSLGIFLVGGVTGGARASLRAADGAHAWFDVDDPVAFHSSGTLEKGTWILELSADVSASLVPNTLDTSTAAAQFRDVRFALAPAPPSGAALLAGGVLASRRRRRRFGRGPTGMLPGCPGASSTSPHA